MSYSTNTTILTYFAALPQSAGAAGYAKTILRLDSHVGRADTLINSKIARRYDITGYDTTGAVPPLLRTLSEDIASYFSFRAWFGQDNQNVNDWTDKFNDAVNILDEVRDGNIDLVNTAGSMIPEITSSTSEYIDSNTVDYQASFDEDDSLDWKTDSNKLDSIKDGRDG
jgi:phage gp36-like protein